MNDLALLQNQYLKQINTFGILRTAVLPTVNPTNLGGIHFKTERPLQRRSKPTQKVLKSVLGECSGSTLWEPVVCIELLEEVLWRMMDLFEVLDSEC